METKKQFADSIEILLSKKKLDDIQVSEIIKLTPFSRRTFYRHFKDKYDLASWYFSQFYQSSFGQITKNISWEEALLSHLEIYEKKYNVFKNSYSSLDINGLRNFDIAITRETYERFLLSKGVDIKTELIQFSIEIAARGGTDMVIEWLLGGMKKDKKTFVQLLKQTLPLPIIKYID